MESKTVLLSGGTGFIGSHIIEALSAQNYTVLVLIRNKSNLWRLKELNSKCQVLINMDEANFQNEILKHKPEYFIHTAWQGVSLNERDNWIIQSNNLIYTLKMLSLANQLGIKKILALGSQAEYGYFEGRINEDAPCNPTTAYGSAKLATLINFKAFCEENKINWFWLRIFSLYGERENETWLIPSLIKCLLSGQPMNLTHCEQRYDYMYVGDFALAILKVLETECESGIFNLTSNQSLQLKNIVIQIQNQINPNGILNFGALPYRPNQIMHMEGDSSKFIEKFKVSLNSNFDSMLTKLTMYYKFSSQK